jgi:hypothetical protein
MKKFAAPLVAVLAASGSLGAAAQAITAAPHTGFGGLLHLNPDPSVAWIMAFGFLGLVVLRRTRSGPMN